MILVVQHPGGSARFDVGPIEHYQVPGLVLRVLCSLGIRVVAYSFVHCFQSFGGRLVYRVHPMGIKFAGGVQGSRGSWVGGHGMKSVVGVEGRHPISHGDRIVVGKLRHWE